MFVCKQLGRCYNLASKSKESKVDIGKFYLWEKAYLQCLSLSLKSAECIQPHSASAFKNIVKYFVTCIGCEMRFEVTFFTWWQKLIIYISAQDLKWQFYIYAHRLFLTVSFPTWNILQTKYWLKVKKEHFFLHLFLSAYTKHFFGLICSSVKLRDGFEINVSTISAFTSHSYYINTM